MTLLEKIDFLMEKNELNKNKLSKLADIPYTTIDSLFKIGYEKMKLPTFMKICSFFGVTMDSMAYDENDIEYTALSSRDKLRSDEAALLTDYNSLNAQGQDIASHTVKGLASNEEYIKDTGLITETG